MHGDDRIHNGNDYSGLEINSEKSSDIGFMLRMKAKIETRISKFNVHC